MRRFVLAAVLPPVIILALLVGADRAMAATYSTTCPPADASCAALAERAEALVAATELNGQKLDQLHDDLVASSGQPVTGTVALSTEDRGLIADLHGDAWFAIGLLAVVVASSAITRAVFPR
jgi:hypothetical protein